MGLLIHLPQAKANAISRKLDLTFGYQFATAAAGSRLAQDQAATIAWSAISIKRPA